MVVPLSRRTIKTNDTIIDGCTVCPENIAYPNPLARFLPPTHYCRLMFDPKQPKGRVIWNPNIVPGWCPLAVD